MTGMKQLASIGAIALLMSGGAAFAECLDINTTSSVNPPAAGETAPAGQAGSFQAPPKDGSTAPLEASPDRQAAAPDATQTHPALPGADADAHGQASSNVTQQDQNAPAAGQQDQSAAAPVQKDGSNMPLQSSDADQTGTNRAMSQQDVEAQQEGDETMAAQANKEEC